MEKLSKNELKSIIDEVASALNSEAEAEAKKISTLAKAAPGEATSPELPPDDSATSPTPDASPSPDASASPPAGPDASASPPAGPDASASPPPAGPDAGIPDADGDADGTQGSDPQALEAAYQQLPLPELQMHYLACKAALAAAMPPDATADAGGGAPPPAPDASAAPAPAPDAGVPPDASAPPPAMKTEKGSELPVDRKAIGEDPMKSVAKSEKDAAIASLSAPRATEKDAAIKSLTKTEKDEVAKLVKAVTDFVERPVRKAIVSTTELPKSTALNLDALSKKEVLEGLKKIAEKPTLTKSDRSAITSYALGNVTVDAVKHLFTTATP